MALKRIPPPSVSSDDEKDEQFTDGPDTDDEVVEQSSDDEQQPEQGIKSRKPIMQTPLPQSESEDEDEDEEEGDEEEQTPSPVKKPTIQKPQQSDSDSDSDSGKSQHSPTASDFAVKPITSKPMVDSTKNKKPAKAKLPAATVPVAKPLAKRALEVEQNGSKDSKSKRIKVSGGDATENEEKKSVINRLWSDDDEIAILQGIIDYRLKKGADPNADMGAFHEFIKENLHVEVSKVQLSDKIRRLKKKYHTNVEKGGEDAVFQKPHDCRSFELSKKVWGKGGAASLNGVNDGAKSNNGQAKKSGGKGNNGHASAVKPKGEEKAVVVKEKPKGKDETFEGNAIVVKEKPKGKDEVKVTNGGFAEMYPHLNSALEVQWESEPFRALSEQDRRSMKEKLGRNKKAQELNEEFKTLKVKELEVYSKKLELMKETTGMFLGALKSED